MDSKLSNIVDDIEQGCILRACSTLRNYIHSHQLTPLFDEMQTVNREYSLLLSYARQGAVDAKRDTLLKSITQRLKRMCTDADILCARKDAPFYISQSRRLQDYDLSVSSIRARLEDYVGMTVMAEVDSSIDGKTITEEHHNYTTSLFSHLCMSRTWSSREREEYAQMILSPTIDINDAALLISAITLACLAFFDSQKWLMLTEIYLAADNDVLQQRAFVGWTVTTSGIENDEECRLRLQQLCEDERCLHDVLLIQKEILYSNNTASDNAKIKNDILPKILNSRGNPLNNLGIYDTDTYHDVDADIEAAEEVERYYRQIMKMEHDGSDVFYSGFAHMKRYAFFYNISNWFAPFRVNHPELTKAIGNDEGLKKILVLMNHVNLCDSDCYSMALAMPTIYRTMGQEMKEVIETGIQQHTISKPSATTIRRHYLQDLYRFFNLYPQKHPFKDFFSDIFMINSGFEETKIKDHFIEIVRTLEKLKLYDKMDIVFGWCSRYGLTTLDMELQLIVARRCLHTKKYHEARVLYFLLYTTGTKTEEVLRGLAYSLLMLGEHKEASDYYKILAKEYPENIRYRMCYLHEMTHQGKAQEVANDIFLLNFQATEANDKNILYASYRLLAWTMLCMGRYEEAIRHYNLLKSKQMHISDDLMHQGIALWLAGNTKEALCELKTWYSENDDDDDDDNDNENDDDNEKPAENISDKQYKVISQFAKKVRHYFTFFTGYDKTDGDLLVLCELLRME